MESPHAYMVIKLQSHLKGEQFVYKVTDAGAPSSLNGSNDMVI